MPLISNLLQEILRCPVCRGPLEVDEAKGVLRCPKDNLEFPVREDIPIMQVDTPTAPVAEPSEASS